MHHFDLFGFYRFMLAVVVSVYATCRFVHFVWCWQGFGRGPEAGEALLKRYLVTLFLRARLRRFVYDILVLGGLAVVLFLLLRAHAG